MPRYIPRWTYPIATGWSNDNRTKRNPEEQKVISERALSRLVDFSREYYAQHPDVDGFVYGHIHLARVEQEQGMPPVVFLGEWITLNTYVVLDESGNFRLMEYKE